MSWIKKRPLLAVAALAFAVRAAVAVATEFKPLFPAYYYTDARLANADALTGLSAVLEGRPVLLTGPLSHRLIVLMTLGTYRVFGPRLLAVKLLNALLGAIGVTALVAAFALVFPAPSAFAAGAAIALWPSHVFYTSQNLKESPTHALASIGLLAALTLGLRPPESGTRRAALAALALGSLMGVGFLRGYVLLCLSGALCVAFALAAARPGACGRELLVFAVAASAAALYLPASHSLFGALRRPGDYAGLSLSDAAGPSLLPLSVQAETNAVSRPTSPEGVTAFRHAYQAYDRRWAAAIAQREIGTQIFPDADFHTWGDVLAFLPKGAFYVLFMPLPGLYPMDGKIGRIAASAENLVLLALACFAAAGILRGPKTAGRAALLLYFAAMTTGTSLLEFDLGSAGRHKLLYLPMLFPFAAEEIMRLLGRKEPA